MKNENQLQSGSIAPNFTFETPWEKGLTFDPSKSELLFFF